MNLVPLFVAIPLGAAFLIPLLGIWWKKSGEVLATRLHGGAGCDGDRRRSGAPAVGAPHGRLDARPSASQS